MPAAILIIGAILVVSAFNNSFGALATELETDVAAYFKWALAVAAICALGYIPGFRTPSRYLLGLVLLVILLTNYTQIYAGFTAFSSSGGTASGGTGAANPSAAYTANPATTTDPTATQIAGNATGGAAAATAGTSGTQVASAASIIAANPLSPSSYLSALGSSGFGGIV